MYANRYGGDRRLQPASLAVALAINGGVLTAVLLAAPEMITKPIYKPFKTYPVIDPPPPPPEPAPPLAKANPAPAPKPVIPKSIVPDPSPPVDLTLKGGGDVIVDAVGGTDGTGAIVEPPAPPAPVFTDPAFDQRYARSFQPAYPPAERRLEREGSVTVRVLIGTDGRVKQVERQAATSDDFFATTQRAALAQWRFRPATRNGVPIERWKTIHVTFQLEDG